jgi:hypothetical protein
VIWAWWPIQANDMWRWWDSRPDLPPSQECADLIGILCHLLDSERRPRMQQEPWSAEDRERMRTLAGWLLEIAGPWEEQP